MPRSSCCFPSPGPTRNCATAGSTSWRAPRTRRSTRSRTGTAASCSPPSRSTCTGSWCCARTSARSAATCTRVKGLRIGAAPGPVDGLKRMLVEAGIDPERDVKIGPVPGTAGAGVSFGVAAAKALEEGQARRLLGERHGRGGGGAQRHRHAGARCAPRRRSGGGARLHLPRVRDDAAADRRGARTRRGGGARARRRRSRR